MGTCDTCKWWSDEDTAMASHDSDTCCRCDYAETFYPHAEDNMGSEETIYTGPKFGCIHHEPK